MDSKEVQLVDDYNLQEQIAISLISRVLMNACTFAILVNNAKVASLKSCISALDQFFFLYINLTIVMWSHRSVLHLKGSFQVDHLCRNIVL